MPGQQKAQGYYTSVGTSFGLGERSNDEPHMIIPGVGTYEMAQDAQNNMAPAWK